MNDVWNTLATWDSDKNCLYCENKLLFPSVSFFQHERNPYLQIISPDLSVTVFVTLWRYGTSMASPLAGRRVWALRFMERDLD